MTAFIFVVRIRRYLLNELVSENGRFEGKMIKYMLYLVYCFLPCIYTVKLQQLINFTVFLSPRSCGYKTLKLLLQYFHLHSGVLVFTSCLEIQIDNISLRRCPFCLSFQVLTFAPLFLLKTVGILSLDQQIFEKFDPFDTLPKKWLPTALILRPIGSFINHSHPSGGQN